MAKRERAVYAFRRTGNTLVPEMDMDLRALDGVANGDRVRVEVKEFRSLGRHRAYWAMLHDVVAATDCALTPERLHEIVKLRTGLVEHVVLPDGMMIALPGSIAFDKVSEDEFVAFFKRAEEFLAQTYGYVTEDEAA